MTDRVEVIHKNGFTGLRFYLELPASMVPAGLPIENHGLRPANAFDNQEAIQYKAPFIHHPGDDDSSAVTFWGKRDLRTVLIRALELLDEHYTKTVEGGKMYGNKE